MNPEPSGSISPSQLLGYSNDEVIELFDALLKDSARRIDNYHQLDDAAALLDGIKFAGAIRGLLDAAMYHVGGPLLYCAEDALIKQMREARFTNEDP